MKEHPILFSTPMVQAILEGRKTQTRRIVKPQPPLDNEDDDILVERDDCMGYPALVASWEGETQIHNVKFPYGVEGDILWVRETWRQLIDCTTGEKAGFTYCATDEEVAITESLEKRFKSKIKWKPSIHMPKEACRLFLKIKSVRVERLQDISEKDAIAEGVKMVDGETMYQNYYLGEGTWETSAKNSFCSLWESINGPESWEANPWVWVIEWEPSNSKLGKIIESFTRCGEGENTCNCKNESECGYK